MLPVDPSLVSTTGLVLSTYVFVSLASQTTKTPSSTVSADSKMGIGCVINCQYYFLIQSDLQ